MLPAARFFDRKTGHDDASVKLAFQEVNASAIVRRNCHLFLLGNAIDCGDLLADAVPVRNDRFPSPTIIRLLIADVDCRYCDVTGRSRHLPAGPARRKLDISRHAPPIRLPGYLMAMAGRRTQPGAFVGQRRPF